MITTAPACSTHTTLTVSQAGNSRSNDVPATPLPNLPASFVWADDVEANERELLQAQLVLVIL